MCIRDSTGSEGEICNVWDLMEDYYPKSEDTSKVKNFLGNMSVFTRWYAYETVPNLGYIPHIVDETEPEFAFVLIHALTSIQRNQST